MKMSPTTVQIQIEQHQLKKELHSPPSVGVLNFFNKPIIKSVEKLVIFFY